MFFFAKIQKNRIIHSFLIKKINLNTKNDYYFNKNNK